MGRRKLFMKVTLMVMILKCVMLKLRVLVKVKVTVILDSDHNCDGKS